MNSVPTNQQFAEVLGITAEEVRIYVVQSRAIPIQGGWVLTFAERTPKPILSKLQLTKTLSCTVLLPPQ